MGYMYLTVIFLHCAVIGHEYLLVGYNYDTGAILVGPLKNFRAKTIVDR